MPVGEPRRHALYSRLQEVLGTDEAETFMQLTPPTEWTDLATRQDVERLDMKVENVRVGLEARIDRLEAHVESVRVGLEARIENVRVGLEARIDGLEADLRATEARLIGELHRLLRLQTIWLIGAIFTLAALILTAAKFL